MSGLPASCATLVWSLSASVTEFGGEQIKINGCPERAWTLTEPNAATLACGPATPRRSMQHSGGAWDIPAHH